MDNFEPEEIGFDEFIGLLSDGKSSGVRFVTILNHHKICLIDDGCVILENMSVIRNDQNDSWICDSEWLYVSKSYPIHVAIIKIDEVIRIALDYPKVASWFLFNLHRFC